jgi:hypothetical protein
MLFMATLQEVRMRLNLLLSKTHLWPLLLSHHELFSSIINLWLFFPMVPILLQIKRVKAVLIHKI